MPTETLRPSPARRRVLAGALCALALSALSLGYRANEVCCMFAAERHFGFPATVFSLSKSTDDRREAQKVFSLGSLELARQGWEFRPRGAYGSPWAALAGNFVFYAIAVALAMGTWSLGRRALR